MDNKHHATLYRADLVSEFELSESDSEIEDRFFERLGVDDARELIKQANLQPAETSKKLLVVRTNFITHEAQNALLKILEEPPVSTHFAFVLPFDFNVLPTLLSRFSQETRVEVDTQITKNIVFETFLTQSYKERLTSIDESIKKQDVNWQRSVKQGLVQYLKKPITDLELLSELEYVTRILLTRGASNKMLLQHAALILPVR